MRSPASPFGPASTPFDERIRELVHNGVIQVLHTVWKLEYDRQPRAREHRRAPQDAELSGCYLLDREIRRARLVRQRRKRHE
jgi:hypothetical protein